MAYPPIDIDNRFNHHPPTGKKIADHETWRGGCKALAATLVDLLPEGREKSLAMTALEECLMWGNAAIARAAD